MKNHFLATIFAVSLWFVVVLGAVFVSRKYFSSPLFMSSIIYLSMFVGLLSGITFLYISKTRRLVLLLLSLTIISLAWVFAFPTPDWKNPILWSWPIIGFMCMFMTAFIGSIYGVRRKST